MLKIFNQKILLIFALIILINKNVYSNWLKVAEVSASSCILPLGDIILVGTNNGIYRSVDNGLSWSHYTVDNPYSVITDLSKNDDYIFAGTYNGVYSSADTGKTWSCLGPSYSILSVYAKDSIVFVCIHGGGLFRSENNGQSWTPIDGNHFYSYLLYNNKIFVSFLYNSLWYYDLSQMTNVSELNNSIPNRFILQQNYPNPFNQSTKITYSVSKSDHVILKIYDVLGSEIKTLVNNFQLINTYSINFNASNLSSGIYFYKFQIGKDFVQTRKMLLIR